MDTPTEHLLTSRDDLAARFDPPTERLRTKALDHVNAAGRNFIARSPFLVLATCGADGLDCSPKGDAPGFVIVSEDGKTLFIPDRVGNNRIDGLKNLVEDARVATIFLIPGANETYRVNGRARISSDPELRQRFVVKGKEPKVVLVISVEQAFQHCPKALLRSKSLADRAKRQTRGRADARRLRGGARRQERQAGARCLVLRPRDGRAVLAKTTQPKISRSKSGADATFLLSFIGNMTLSGFLMRTAVQACLATVEIFRGPISFPSTNSLLRLLFWAIRSCTVVTRGLRCRPTPSTSERIFR